MINRWTTLTGVAIFFVVVVYIQIKALHEKIEHLENTIISLNAKIRNAPQPQVSGFFQWAPPMTQPQVAPPDTSTPGSTQPRAESPQLRSNNLTDGLGYIKSEFKNLDLSDNGSIDAVEAAIPSSGFDLLDWNQDGEVSQEEVDRTQRYVERAESHAAKHDKADGKFPIEREAYEGSKKRFQYVDQNHDGIMEADEYYQFLLLGRNQLRRFDMNNDGDITHEEFGGSLMKFQKLDTDKNKSIDVSEVQDAIARGQW